MSGINAPRKRLGAWLSRTVDTIYQAPTDGTVNAFATTNGNRWVKGFTDDSTPPTAQRSGNSSYSEAEAGLSIEVKKGDYWKITAGADGGTTTTIFWIPWGP